MTLVWNLTSHGVSHRRRVTRPSAKVRLVVDSILFAGSAACLGLLCNMIGIHARARYIYTGGEAAVAAFLGGLV